MDKTVETTGDIARSEKVDKMTPLKKKQVMTTQKASAKYKTRANTGNISHQKNDTRNNRSILCDITQISNASNVMEY